MTNQIPPKQNQDYYLEDGNVVFLVENELFRVHRHFLVRDSVIFRDLLKMPAPLGDTKEGLSDNNPIVLEGIKSVDFSNLLWIFYNQDYDGLVASVYTWKSILHVADMWMFEAIRTLAIKKLCKIIVDPIEKLEVLYQYKIDLSKWAPEALKALCRRAEFLSDDEAQKIGLVTSIQIARMRDVSIKREAAALKAEVEQLKKESGGIMGMKGKKRCLPRRLDSPPSVRRSLGNVGNQDQGQATSSAPVTFPLIRL